MLFWGENFSRKNFFREGDLGGVYTELLNFGGGPDGIRRKWGGSIGTPPHPGMFMTPFQKSNCHYQKKGNERKEILVKYLYII